MTWWYLLTPVAVLAILALFRYVGCEGVPDITFVDDPYDVKVKADTPVSYWRLQEAAGPTAQDEMLFRDGTFGTAPSPLDPGPPAVKSTGANPTLIQVGSKDVPLFMHKPLSETPEVSVRVGGGFVQVPSAGPLNPPQFTLEALVFPEWDLTQLGSFYCVLESSSPKSGDPSKAKKFGYAIYGGPDNPADPASPYQWQVWVGTGSNFVRLGEKKPYAHAANDKGEVNPGPKIEAVPTYIAVTFSTSQAFLFMYIDDRDMDFVKYELDHQPYAANVSADLFLGISGPGERALFAPPGPNQFLYPFKGRMTEIAVYGKALDETQIVQHIGSAFFR